MKQENNTNKEIFVTPYQNTMDIENGFTHCTKEKNIWSKYDSLGRYIPEDVAEGKKELQQLIPYIIIKSDKFKYFVLQLTNCGKKYKNTMALGICDHIKYEDGLKEPLFKAATRCLLENIDLQVLKPFNFKGYVREMNGEVNDHFGIVLEINDIPEDSISVKSTDFIGKWYTKKELIEHYGRFEDWSKHLIDFMVDKSL